jgi:hypothetical protein
MRSQRGRVGLMAAALVGMVASGATAEVTTEQSASILVFPKVIADSTRDTIIQITNTSNSMVHAHCFYVNGGLTFPDGLDGIPNSGDEFPGPGNPVLWTELDFDIWLTKQQPTYWVVSQGRLVNPADEPCTRDNTSCANAGFDPGRVPPVVENFTGELKCIEVDASGAPLSGNHLKGEATLETAETCDFPQGAEIGTCRQSQQECEVTADCPGTTGDVAKYNALGIIGLETNDSDNVLCLGGEPTDGCPNGAEYDACPQEWILNHYADDAEDLVVGNGSNVDPFITVVPCAENFETQVPETVTIQFRLTNEFEQPFSTSTSVTCWAELDLDNIDFVFDRDAVGSDFVQTRMRPSTGTNSGFLVVADEVHSFDGGEAAAAANVHVEGERPGPDKIVIPAEQLPPQP